MMQSPVIVTLQLLLFFSLLSSIYTSVADQERYFFCGSTGNYTTGSIYGQNVNITLTSLVANASLDGFSITTVGQVLDMVYGLVQCRSDVSEEDCQTCVDTAAKEISQFCPEKKEAMIGYNNCSLRYSDWRFFSTSSSSPIFSFYNTGNANDPDHFNTQLADLFRNLSSTAASNTSKFAVGSISYSDFSDIYGKKKASKTTVVVVVSTATVALLVMFIVCGNYFWRKAKKKVADVHDDYEKNMESLVIGLDTLKAATRNFSDENKLGQGGFGLVYKGKLFDGREIAVKRLSRNSGQGLEELKTEVMLVAKLLHRNLLRIIHRDLKASNILLDEHMNPKISDFGLAKLFGESQTKRNAGTYFSVLVLEIVTGRKNSTFRNSINLQSHAWLHWTNGTALELLDPVPSYQCLRFEVLKCIHIGLLCVQEAAADRPTMSEIIMMLSSHSITAPPPSRPAYLVSK
ncbi:hypothetical protein CRYUN_Cryun10bG0079800 [Craigia yunnanensis]